MEILPRDNKGLNKEEFQLIWNKNNKKKLNKNIPHKIFSKKKKLGWKIKKKIRIILNQTNRKYFIKKLWWWIITNDNIIKICVYENMVIMYNERMIQSNDTIEWLRWLRFQMILQFNIFFFKPKKWIWRLNVANFYKKREDLFTF